MTVNKMEYEESDSKIIIPETMSVSGEQLAQHYTSNQSPKGSNSPNKRDLYEVLHSLIDTVSTVPTPTSEDARVTDNESSIITCNINEKIDQHTIRLEDSLMEEMSISEDTKEDENTMDNVIERDTNTVDEQTINRSDHFYYNWNISPKLLCAAKKEFEPTAAYENFTKGCQWSPDGTCLLVPSEDFRLRIYELPRELYSGKISDLSSTNLSPTLTIKEGGLIYDSCWYPYMNSWEPATCCFLSTSRESPAHLWDAFNGELRATYRAYNQVDEVEASISLQFVDSGKEIWCGFKNALRTFDTERPGRQVNTIEFKKDFPNVTGLVSCIRENPIMPGLIAFGTYSKCIGLYKNGPLCTFKTGNGVTQVEFSPCGTKLFSAVRRSGEFLCWDLRNPGVILYSLEGRQSNTNQRIQFTFSPSGKQIVSGGTDGTVTVWELPENVEYEEELDLKYKVTLSQDCINGISLHKSLPLIATSSGQRWCVDQTSSRDNSVRLWWTF